MTEEEIRLIEKTADKLGLWRIVRNEIVFEDDVRK